MKWLIALVASIMLATACAGPSFGGRLKDKLPDVPRITSTEYAALDWAAWIGTGVAVIGVFACVWFPGEKVRATVGAAIGVAVGSWILKFLLVKYLWIAVGLSFGAAIIVALAFLWGHRAWVERKLNLDLDKSGAIGDEPH